MTVLSSQDVEPDAHARTTIEASRDVIDRMLEFEDRGSHVLKGVPGEWGVFEVIA